MYVFPLNFFFSMTIIIMIIMILICSFIKRCHLIGFTVLYMVHRWENQLNTYIFKCFLEVSSK